MLRLIWSDRNDGLGKISRWSFIICSKGINSWVVSSGYICQFFWKACFKEHILLSPGWETSQFNWAHQVNHIRGNTCSGCFHLWHVSIFAFIYFHICIEVTYVFYINFHIFQRIECFKTWGKSQFRTKHLLEWKSTGQGVFTNMRTSTHTEMINWKGT